MTNESFNILKSSILLFMFFIVAINFDDVFNHILTSQNPQTEYIVNFFKDYAFFYKFSLLFFIALQFFFSVSTFFINDRNSNNNIYNRNCNNQNNNITTTNNIIDTNVNKSYKGINLKK